MKTYLTRSIVLGLLATFRLVGTCHGEPYDVFLVAGQSNCDGRGKAAELTGAFSQRAEPQNDVLIAYSCSTLRGPALQSNGWKPLQPGWSVAPGKGRPKSLPSATFRPEVAFGRTLADALPGRHIALLKFCEGGTSLSKDWNPQIKDRLYDAMMVFVKRSLKGLHDAGHTYAIRGMIWHQGESDAALPSDQYQSLLTAFITRVRGDLDVPKMPFGIGEVYDNGKRDQVRAALKATATAVPCAFFVSCEGLKTSDAGTHFDTAGQIELGSRFAAGMVRALDQH
jgi:hypothetical protein